jgi:hypothetical protein
MRLTQINEEQQNLDDVEDFSTASLVEYAMRDGCTDAEYYVGKRLQKLRHIALRFAKALEEEGRKLELKDLQAIDVMVEITTDKRLYRKEQ